MKRRPNNEIERWLEAEAGARDQAAEEALAALFVALPRSSPSAAFADRVAARVAAGARVSMAAVRRPLSVRRGLLLVLTLALLSLGSLLLVPLVAGPAVAAASGEVGLARIFAWLAEGVTRASHLFVGSLLLLDKMLDLARGFVVSSARSPGLATVAISSLVLSTAAFLALKRVIGRERNFRYASF